MIAPMLGLDTDFLIVVEHVARFVCPLRRAIDGEIIGSPLDISTLRPMLVFSDAGIKLFGIVPWTGRALCDAIIESRREVFHQCWIS